MSSGSPYGSGACPFPYGDVSNPHFHMVITIWKRGPVSLCSPYGNGDTHMETGIYKGCVYPRFHMVIAVLKRGVDSLDSPYGNGDHHMETGIPVSKCWSSFPCCDSVMEINYAQNGHVNCFLLHKCLVQWWKTHPTPDEHSLFLVHIFASLAIPVATQAA